MESAALLDLLGNRNRRRILRLLARKPCYVTEISEHLGVSPKAVIGHLEKLEAAGLIESHTDDRRRKYFHIARNVRLEVNVSPYDFGTKSAYAASANLDLTRWSHLTLEIETDAGESPRDLVDELRELEQLENELSMAQRWVRGRLTDVLDDLTDSFGDGVDDRLAAELLRALAEEPHDGAALAARVEAPRRVIEETLETLAREGVVGRRGDRWELV